MWKVTYRAKLEHNYEIKDNWSFIWILRIHFYEVWKMQRTDKHNWASQESNKSTKQPTLGVHIIR